MLTIWAWANLASLEEPLFLSGFLVFLLGVWFVGRRTTTPSSAAEFGIFFGFVYGVAVWGSLGYYFEFSPYAKMLMAGAVILDGAYLSALVRLAYDRRERATA